MIDDDPAVAYRQCLDEVRTELAHRRRWDEMPRLLDALDTARSRVSVRRGQHEQLWVGQFVSAVERRTAGVARERVKEAARELWPWLGWYDPEAVGAGRWEELPRSNA